MSRMQYSDYIKKFEDKKTSDDTFTADWCYDAVARYVTRQYGISRDRFVRPFYPGGDYQRFDYNPDDVVVDNPPFSIGSKIRDFYHEHGISFFLFCPAFNTMPKHSESMVFIKSNIEFDNGAKVKCAFITNLERNTLRTDSLLNSELSPKSKAKPAVQHLPGCIVPGDLTKTGATDQVFKYERWSRKLPDGRRSFQVQFIPFDNDENKEDD